MSKRKLLLADDSVTIQKVVNLTFADEGIEVIAVGNGDAAMEKIEEAVPDVILADVHMPGLNGYQICERIRQNPATSQLPVVLLVGSFEPFDEAEAERVGANSYLTKPFQSIRQLVSQVSDLIEASGDPSHDPTIAQMFAEHPEVTEFVEEPVDVPAETGDIDTLYERSFVAPAHAAEADATPVLEAEIERKPFSDVGMDDEMIETISTSPTDDANSFESVQYAVTEQSYESAEPDTYSAETGSYSTNDPWTAPADDDAPTASYDLEEITAAESASFGQAEQSEVSFEGSQLREQPTEDHSYADQFERTDQMPSVTSEFTLDEIELLELPPIENGKSVEFTTRDVGPDGENKQVVSLSPELMEALVEKVVKRLSEKQ